MNLQPNWVINRHKWQSLTIMISGVARGVQVGSSAPSSPYTSAPIPCMCICCLPSLSMCQRMHFYYTSTASNKYASTSTQTVLYLITLLMHVILPSAVWNTNFHKLYAPTCAVTFNCLHPVKKLPRDATDNDCRFQEVQVTTLWNLIQCTRSLKVHVVYIGLLFWIAR